MSNPLQRTDFAVSPPSSEMLAAFMSRRRSISGARSPIPPPQAESTTHTAAAPLALLDEIPPIASISSPLPPSPGKPPMSISLGTVESFNIQRDVTASRPRHLRRAFSDHPARRVPVSPLRRTLSGDRSAFNEVPENLLLESGDDNRHEVFTLPAPSSSPSLYGEPPLRVGDDGLPANIFEQRGTQIDRDLHGSDESKVDFPDSERSSLPEESSSEASNSAPAVDYIGDVPLVDEGDVLPTGDFTMDVVFDDEGLNTLERIFLLSKSEYAFHRAYVARVLGDLLEDVDPCESVEYVLPLLSGFGMDEDEGVKESFSAEIHRILWYFYSTAKLVEQDDADAWIASPGAVLEESIDDVDWDGVRSGEITETPGADGSEVESPHTLTVTSAGLAYVDRPTPAEIVSEAIVVPQNHGRSASLLSSTGPSTGSTKFDSPQSTPRSEIDTPATTDTGPPTAKSDDTMFSSHPLTGPRSGTQDSGYSKVPTPLVDRPALAVNFFTPLLGSLLLNSNPTISESARSAIVALMSRLRGREADPFVWGSKAREDIDERRTFISQTGLHAHDLLPFNETAREAVESELLHGIIIGMASLSTEVPPELLRVESRGRASDGYFGASGEDAAQIEEEVEVVRAQLELEAMAGRATSVNLIGSVCEFYSPLEVVANGFINQLVACEDGDSAVRAEGAVAVGHLAKVVPVEEVHRLVSRPRFLRYSTDHAASDL